LLFSLFLVKLKSVLNSSFWHYYFWISGSHISSEKRKSCSDKSFVCFGEAKKIAVLVENTSVLQIELNTDLNQKNI